MPNVINYSMRLVFMGTPAFALPTLQALHEAGHAIVAIYTQPPRPAGRGQKESPSPVHHYALEHSLPVYTPESLKSPETQAQFVAHKVDAAIVAAYGLLLPKPILEAYPLGCINIHPSLLPRWRGAAPIQRTLMAADHETGIVIMQMDAGLDTGDILLVERYPIAEGMTAGELHDMLAQKAAPLLLKALRGLQDKTITPVKQPDTGVEYAKKITKADVVIDWNRPAEAIYHQILGLNPSPGATFTYKDETIKIFAATYDADPIDAIPGTIINDTLGVACHPGALYPAILQRPGKKRMRADELLRGFYIPAGSILA